MVNLYFFDSSSLVKRYLREPGSEWVWQIAEKRGSDQILVSRLTWVEVQSALSRRRREGGLDKTLYTLEQRALRYHFAVEYRVTEVDKDVIEQAGELVQYHPLRAADAIQLASAIRVRSQLDSGAVTLRFITSDIRLLSAAEANGLESIDPALKS